MAKIGEIQRVVCTVVAIDHQEAVIMNTIGDQKYIKPVSIQIIPECDRSVGSCFKLCSMLDRTDSRTELMVWGEAFTAEELKDPEWDRMIKELEKPERIR